MTITEAGSRPGHRWACGPPVFVDPKIIAQISGLACARLWPLNTTRRGAFRGISGPEPRR